MTDRHDAVDPVALLGSLPAPAGWNERTDLDTDTRARSILDRVLSGTVVSLDAARRRRRLRIVTGVVVSAALGGAVAAALWERSPDEARTLSCWSDPSVPPAAQIGVGWDGATDPIEICTPEWNGGRLGMSGPPTELTVCVASSGAPAVIPGSAETCDALDLARYTPIEPGGAPGDSEALDVGLATERLDERFNARTCVAAQVAEDGTREVLSELGFDGWAIEIVGTFSDVEPCATVALDMSRSTASVVFVARDDAASD